MATNARIRSGSLIVTGASSRSSLRRSGSLSSGSLGDRNMTEKEKKRKMGRANVISEIISTENSYVKSLEVIREVYIKPLRKRRRILSLREEATIFSNIENLHAIHVNFLHELTERQKLFPDETPIVDIFLNFCPWFDMYTQYVSNYEAVTSLLMKLGKRKRWKQFLEECARDPRTTLLNIDDYLVMPIQRIPRYKLLLEELLRRSDETSNDQVTIPIAIEKVHSAVVRINTTVQVLDKMLSIQGKFLGNVHLLAPNRRFIKQGTLKKHSRSASGRRWYHFFLFNDLLVYARRSKRSFRHYRLRNRLCIDKRFRVSSSRLDSANGQTKFLIKIFTSTKDIIGTASLNLLHFLGGLGCVSGQRLIRCILFTKCISLFSNFSRFIHFYHNSSCQRSRGAAGVVGGTGKLCGPVTDSSSYAFPEECWQTRNFFVAAGEQQL